MLIVRVRSFLARHRAAHAAAVLLPGVIAAAVVANEVRQLTDERASWGERRTVWLAAVDLAPGQPVVASRRELPGAALPETALTDDPTGLPVLQRVGRGEILTRLDVASSPLAPSRFPTNARMVAVPVDEQSLGVTPGDRVDIVAGGVTLAEDGLVVAVAPSAVTVAVDDSSAPLVAAAALDGTAALIGRPAG